jgi:hypothetical protein
MDVGQFDFAEQEARQSITPVWVDGNHKTKQGLLKWFGQTQPLLERIHENRIRRMNLNLGWYLNETSGSLGAKLLLGTRTLANISADQMPVVVGHMYELTEQRVSRLSSYKPAFDVAPTHTEETDRITARLLKPCLDAVARNNNLDFLIQEIERWTAVFGECFVGIDWDAQAGDLKKGKPIGDVTIFTKEPFWVFYEPKRHWRDVSFITEVKEIIHVEEARVKYKDASIQADSLQTVYTFAPDIMKGSDEVVVYRVIYKPSQYLPDGLIFEIAGNKVVLVERKYPYSHNDFPYERHTDIDVPGRIFPMSGYNYLIPLQNTYNKLTALINRNILLTAHPKWMAQKGSVDMKTLGNTASIAWYNPGTPKPELATFNSVNADTYTFRQDMRSEMQTIYGIQGVSRGTPPAGSRAASMLQFYEEQEVKRNSTLITKHNELIRKIITKAASIIGDRYPLNPDRLIRTVGKNNRYKIYRLAEVKISSNYDIIIQNSTGFSESKAGRIEEIGFLQQTVPGLLRPEQIADILEIAQPQKAYDILTAALDRVNEENSDFMDGIPVSAPEPSDDHITHWTNHVIFMQTETYRRLPKVFKDSFQDHVLVHEMFIEKMKDKSQASAQQIDMLPNFPIFLPMKTALPEPQAQPQPQPMGMEMAGMGDPLAQGAPLQVPAEMAMPQSQGMGDAVLGQSLPNF